MGIHRGMFMSHLDAYAVSVEVARWVHGVAKYHADRARMLGHEDRLDDALDKLRKAEHGLDLACSLFLSKWHEWPNGDIGLADWEPPWMEAARSARAEHEERHD